MGTTITTRAGPADRHGETTPLKRTAAIRNTKNALQLSHLPADPKWRLQEGDEAGHRRRPTKVVGFHPGAGGGRGGGSWISKPPSRRKHRLERRRRRGRRSRPRNYSDPELPTPHPRSPPPDPDGLTRRKQQHGGAVFRSGEGEQQGIPPRGARIHRQLAARAAEKTRSTTPTSAARLPDDAPSPAEAAASNPRPGPDGSGGSDPYACPSARSSPPLPSLAAPRACPALASRSGEDRTYVVTTRGGGARSPPCRPSGATRG